ncbi:MAG: ABC transporter permease [Myxococcota bacterium]
MRALLVFGKCARQQARDPLGLALTLMTAPAFALLYGLFFAGDSGTGPGGQRPFDAFVPGLLVFAVIMVVYSASMAVAKEVESGALQRLRLTPLTALDYLGGVSLFQLSLGALSVGLTLLAAMLMGFQSRGAALTALALGALASASSVGIGMVVASLSRTTSRAFLIASVAMFLLLLFSGVVFPRPSARLFEVVGHPVSLFDALPTTHLHAAFSALFGEAPARVGLRAWALFSLSALYFGVGVSIFDRRFGLAKKVRR